MVANPTSVSAPPVPIANAVREWITQAQAKLASSPLTEADLATLANLVAGNAKVRQRLMYMHAAMPTPTSHIHALFFAEPVPGGGNIELVADYKFPYNSPHEAVMDGWQIVKFPEYRFPILDREVDVQGYQFVLQKMEVYRD
jgi:hypothetical protein